MIKRMADSLKKWFNEQLIIKMIANGSDNEAIQKLTDAPIEEIEALRQQG